jgi:TolB-like protein
MSRLGPALHGLFRELKRRRVFRVAAIYAGAGFVFLEAVSLLAPVLLLPESVYRGLGIVVLLGFPVAIAASWFFDLTPEGVRRTEPLGEDELEPGTTNVAEGAVAAAFALVLVGALAIGGWRMLRPGAGPGADAGTGATTAVAVLPWANLSPNPADTYLALGLHDELLTQLYKIGGLRVPSRTTMLRYRNTEKDLPTIAAELQSPYVLAGTVEPRGDRVRMRVQLVDAATDTPLWAESYDRPMEDLHAIEEDIARRIASELRVRLLPEESARIAARPTESVEAYDLYLRGKADGQLGQERWRGAVDNLKRATEVDPAFAEAFALLGTTYLRGYWWSLADHAESIRLGIEAIERATELDPDGAETLLAQATRYLWVERDYEAVIERVQRVREIAPGDHRSLVWLFAAQRRLGRLDDAIETLRERIERDPSAPGLLSELWWTYIGMRRFADAERVLERRFELVEDPLADLTRWVASFQATGDTAAFRRRRDELVEVFPGLQSGVGLPGFRVHFWLREYEAAVAALDGVKEDVIYQQTGPRPKALWSLLAYRGMGDLESAREQARVALTLLDEHEAETLPEVRHRDRALALAVLGRRDEALSEARRAVEIGLPDRWFGPTYRENLMHVHIILGDADEAIDLLGALLETEYFQGVQSMTPQWVRVDPRFDPLRGHPRFRQLMDQEIQ